MIPLESFHALMKFEIFILLITLLQRDHMSSGMFHCLLVCLTFLVDLLFSTDVKVYVGSYILNLVDLTECLQKIKVNICRFYLYSRK